VVLDHDGNVVASADRTAIEHQQKGEMPNLGTLGRNSNLLTVVRDHLSAGVSLGALTESRQVEFTASKTADRISLLSRRCASLTYPQHPGPDPARGGDLRKSR
jgi:hypothetical protein